MVGFEGGAPSVYSDFELLFLEPESDLSEDLLPEGLLSEAVPPEAAAESVLDADL